MSGQTTIGGRRLISISDAHCSFSFCTLKLNAIQFYISHMVSSKGWILFQSYGLSDTQSEEFTSRSAKIAGVFELEY